MAFEFQSPIGTNKTVVDITNVVLNVVSFNPLQVQTKRKSTSKRSGSPGQFQSPIGTNKTIKNFQTIGAVVIVSIPYRYKQNSQWQEWLYQLWLCFNPLQVQTKLAEVPKGMQDTVVFQSPIGTNKTAKNITKPVFQQCVSIPYRYKQNEEALASLPYPLKMFQSPIGTNKTRQLDIFG